MQLIPMSQAVLCVNCGVVSDATGEECPGCAGRGSLMSLSTILEKGVRQSTPTMT